MFQLLLNYIGKLGRELENQRRDKHSTYVPEYSGKWVEISNDDWVWVEPGADVIKYINVIDLGERYEILIEDEVNPQALHTYKCKGDREAEIMSGYVEEYYNG